MLTLHLEQPDQFAWFERRDVVEALLPTTPGALFDYLDDQEHLSAHMTRRRPSMLGGRMALECDAGGARRVGSRFRLHGRVLGVPLDVTSIVTEHDPPWHKAWRTVGLPRLLVIGAYRIRLDITPLSRWPSARALSRLIVTLDYDLPRSGLARLAGRLLGPAYARWCARQIVSAALGHFNAGGDDAVASPKPAPPLVMAAAADTTSRAPEPWQ